MDDEMVERTPANDVTLGRREFLTRLGGLAAIGALGLSGSESVTAALARRNAPRPDAADRDPLDLLKRMVSYDTQNFGRGGATRPFAEMLKSVWTRAGVFAEIIPTPQPNNVHLVARIKGTTSAAPVLMLGHSDVVPVERAKWAADPFAGVSRTGRSSAGARWT